MRSSVTPSSDPSEPLTLEQCDPQKVIAQALCCPLEFRPHDVFLAWVMALPVEVDAAEAARILLHVHRHFSTTPARVQIYDFLIETAACSIKSGPIHAFSKQSIH